MQASMAANTAQTHLQLALQRICTSKEFRDGEWQLQQGGMCARVCVCLYVCKETRFVSPLKSDHVFKAVGGGVKSRYRQIQLSCR